MYIHKRLFVWDEPKRLKTLRTRRLDFQDADEAFFVESAIVPARNGRYKAIGWLDGLAIVVVFAPLGSEAVTIISMRRANRKEGSVLA